MNVRSAVRANSTFLVLLLVWHAVGFGIALYTGNITLVDSRDYLYAAHNLVEHGVYYAADLHQPWDADYVSRRPPVYPVVIALCRAVGGSPYSVLVVQALVSISTLWGVSLLLQRRFGYTPSVNRWLLPAVLLAPVQLFYTTFLMAEIVFQALLFWLFYACVVYYRDRAPRALLAASLLLCAALLTKPVLFLLWVPALVAGVVLAWRSRRWRPVVYGALPLLAVVGWSLCNGAWTGYYHFSSMKKTNLLGYNVHALLSRVQGGAAADSIVASVERRAATLGDYGQRTAYAEREAMVWIRRYPVQYALLHVQGAVNLLLDPGRFDLAMVFGLDNSFSLLRVFSGEGGYNAMLERVGRLPFGLLAYLAVVLTANIAFVLSLVLFAVWGRCPVAVKLLLFALVGYILAVTGHVGAARYRTAILPLVLFTVPFAVDVLCRRREQRRRATDAHHTLREGALPDGTAENRTL